MWFLNVIAMVLPSHVDLDYLYMTRDSSIEPRSIALRVHRIRE